MATVYANSKKIMYIGNWADLGKSKVSKNDYCKAFIMFRGTDVTVEAKGEIMCSLDGGADFAKKAFSAKEGVHTLYITAMKDVELISVRVDELLDTNTYLRGNMQAEYDEIAKGREGSDPATFRRIPYKATMPCANAKLDGLFGECLNKNIARIKGCFTQPYYILCNAGREPDKVTPGWVDWLPAANDGRILAGAAKAYLWTKDKKLRAIIDELVDKIEAQMREDGYYNYYTEADSYEANHIPNIENEKKIIMDSERKNYDRTYWTWGLVEAAKAGNTKALGLARKMYDWLEGGKYGKDLLLGHNATNAFMGSLILAESPVGISEDILLNQKCLDQAHVEEELINRNPVIFSNYPGDRPHCYALLVLLSLVYEYRLTGEAHYLEALLGGWEVYKRYNKHVGGATAICESEGPYPAGSYYLATGHTGETCGSVFWTWVNEQLAQLFPDDARYAAEIEEVLFNIAPNVLTENGVRYHSRMQGEKEKGASHGTCCEIMTTHLYSDLPKYVCSYNSKTIWVNQFIGGEFKLGNISLTTEADIIGKGKFTVTVTKAPAAKKTIKVRIPEWAKDAKLYVNGKFVSNALCGDYESIEREWKDGDTVVVTFRPEYRISRYTGAEQLESNAPRYALLYGPYLMALVGSEEDVPTLNVDPMELKVRKVKDSIVIKLEGKMKFVPYYEIGDAVKLCVFPAFKA